LLIYGLSYERGFLAKLLSTRIVVLGGLISYSLYMTHALVLRSYLFYFWDWSHSPHGLVVRWLVLMLLAVALFGMAAAFYYYIEVPGNRKLRRWLDKSPSVQATQTTVAPVVKGE